MISASHPMLMFNLQLFTRQSAKLTTAPVEYLAALIGEFTSAGLKEKTISPEVLL